MGGTTATAIDRSITSRMLRAAKLEAALYEEVEHDTGATGQAALVVVITSVLAGVGTGATGGITGAVVGVIAALLGWAVYAWITFFVGTKLLGGRADWGEVARGLGFASAPRALLILAFIPVLGALLGFAVAIWVLVATVVALREALDFSTARAIGTAVIGWLVQLIVLALVVSLS